MPQVRSARHLHSLNPEQRAAVLHTEGPLLVLAGAGSGKTKTLVHRIVHLIQEGARPSEIVVVTFTNRAADEMRERVQAFAGSDARSVVISTFHSLGVRILRAHGHRLGLPERFAIYSTGDQMAALRTATSEISIADDRFDLKRVLRQISHWKGRRITPEAAAREVREGRTRGNRTDDYDVLAAGAYPRYEEVLRASGAVDFDDLLLLPVRLLEDEEEVRRDLWRRWRYIMIDEYQDTNGVQLDLARHLAGSRRNLCVVGDDDQSIYAFRGADLGNILEFERHFPGADVVTLEQNYRSTQRILAAANAVITGNAHRHPKTLRTENATGAPIDYYEHPDEAAEAETVAKEISVRRFRHRREWGDFAVLYRANTQSRALEEALREQNIPYRVLGGTSFFDRKEVADGVAYLRAVANPDDEIATRRIINYPTRGIGRTTVLRVVDYARERGISFGRALREVGEADVGAPAVAAIGSFLDLLDEAREALAAAEREATRPPPASGWPPIASWAMDLFRQVGIEEAIRSDPRNARSADARVDNLRDLAGSIARYERREWARLGADDAADVDAEAWSPPTLADGLARVALVEPDPNEDDREDDGTVALMTLHSAKGLEFDEVFIIGLEEEILPHARALEGEDAAAGLAEERRLLYVGITRARHRLVLSLCRTRSRGGEPVPTLPSRFLEEIPKDLLQVKTAEAVLTPEESEELKENFFARMKAMLGEDDEAGG